jgi:ABC-2 type transport system permease protein
MFILPSLTLWQREMVRFYRQPSRVIGVIFPPVLFWFVLGSGFGGSFRAGGAGFLEYFFPGSVVLVILFTAIFTSISIIEDRREGFLQAVLAAPVPRAAIALGKTLGTATLAWMQGVLFLCVGLAAGIVHPVDMLPAMAIAFLIAFSVGGLGFIIAWVMRSTQGFHAVMNMFLVPLWLMSGAVFPVGDGPAWIRFASMVNPLSYGVAALQGALRTGGASATASEPMNVAITALAGVLLFGAATMVAMRPGGDA